MWDPTAKQRSEARQRSLRLPACRRARPSLLRLLLSAWLCQTGWLWLLVGTERVGVPSLSPPVSSVPTMPNGIKPVEALDSLSAVSSAYRSGGPPGTCKYWILDLGTHASCTCSLRPVSCRGLLGQLLHALKQTFCAFMLKCVICCPPGRGGCGGLFGGGALGKGREAVMWIDCVAVRHS